jgi:hypothetical protein
MCLSKSALVQKAHEQKGHLQKLGSTTCFSSTTFPQSPIYAEDVLKNYFKRAFLSSPNKDGRSLDRAPCLIVHV